jgi:DNA-binding MarR family transcriptional regulator
MGQNKASLEEVIRVLDRIREFDPDMPVARALMLLLVGRTGVSGMKELAAELNISASGVSRHASALGRYGVGLNPGLELVETQEDPEHRKRKIVVLTAKGKKLLASLVTQ